MFDEKEIEILRTRLLNEDGIKKFFKFLRDHLAQSEQAADQITEMYPNSSDTKFHAANIHKINNGFDVTFDLLEATIRNVLFHNQILTNMLQNIPESELNEYLKRIKEKQIELGKNNSNEEFLEKLKRYYQKMSETTKE